MQFENFDPIIQHSTQKKVEKTYSVVSMFSGCGGLDLGFKGNFNYLSKQYSKNKFRTIWANDINMDACKVFNNYLKPEYLYCGDINKTFHYAPKHCDIILAGFPCQDFSVAGKRRGIKTKRGSLYKFICRMVQQTNPHILFMENVVGLLNIDNGKVIKQIINDFSVLGYHLDYKILNAFDFGVPQKRRRVIFIGTNKKTLPQFNFDFLNPTQGSVTPFQALSDLEHLPETPQNNHCWSKAKRNKGQGNVAIQKHNPAPTIRAEHHGNIEYHWNNQRRLSARECARLQSFPDNFIFNTSTSSAYKQIGNAVPPVLAWHIARSIQKFLDSNL